MGVKIGSLMSRADRKALKSVGKNNDAAKAAAILRVEGGSYIVDVARLPMGSFSVVDGLMVVGDDCVGSFVNAWEASIYKGSYDLLW